MSWHKAGTLARRLLTFALLVALVALSRPEPLWFGVGLPFLLCGEAIRTWAAGHLVKTESLIVSGPYRHTRNPLYLGRLLIWIGLVAICFIDAWISGAVLLVGLGLFFGYYLPRKERVEPERLLRHHGERYAAYRDAVPALFPARRAYPSASPEPWRMNRFLTNREHWMVGGIAGLLALQLARLLS